MARFKRPGRSLVELYARFCKGPGPFSIGEDRAQVFSGPFYAVLSRGGFSFKRLPTILVAPTRYSQICKSMVHTLAFLFALYE